MYEYEDKEYPSGLNEAYSLDVINDIINHLRAIDTLSNKIDNENIKTVKAKVSDALESAHTIKRLMMKEN